MKNHLNICPKCNSPLIITRYNCPSCQTAVNGEFSGCTFCRLDEEDQLFALIFIQTEGNMKDVERLLSISYPTVKSRLAQLNRALAGESVHLPIPGKLGTNKPTPGLDQDERSAILDRLAAGEIDADEAARLLRGELIKSGE